MQIEEQQQYLVSLPNFTPKKNLGTPGSRGIPGTTAGAGMVLLNSGSGVEV
jgi:hypothetical protein